jgi:hypothetical protein
MEGSIVEPEETAAARQRLDKHVSVPSTTLLPKVNSNLAVSVYLWNVQSYL